MSKNLVGLGLIEVIISLTVLVVGILGVLRAFPGGLAVEKNLAHAAIAAQLAQARAEDLLALSYGEIGVGLIENQVRLEAGPADPFYNFRRSTQVAWVDADLNPSTSDLGLKKITVTIFSPGSFGSAGREHALILLKSLK